MKAANYMEWRSCDKCMISLSFLRLKLKEGGWVWESCNDSVLSFLYWNFYMDSFLHGDWFQKPVKAVIRSRWTVKFHPYFLHLNSTCMSCLVFENCSQILHHIHSTGQVYVKCGMSSYLNEILDCSYSISAIPWNLAIFQLNRRCRAKEPSSVTKALLARIDHKLNNFHRCLQWRQPCPWRHHCQWFHRWQWRQQWGTNHWTRCQPWRGKWSFWRSNLNTSSTCLANSKISGCSRMLPKWTLVQGRPNQPSKLLRPP